MDIIPFLTRGTKKKTSEGTASKEEGLGGLNGELICNNSELVGRLMTNKKQMKLIKTHASSVSGSVLLSILTISVNRS